MNSENNSNNRNDNRLHSYNYRKIAVTWGIPIVIVIIALAFAKHQIDTRPQTKLEKPALQARLVKVQTAQQIDHQTFVSVLGTVIPTHQITVTPEVSGKIVSISENVIPGGLIEAGQKLIQIDPRDYETIVTQRKSELAQAKLYLKLEYGSQTVAQQEYKLLGEVIKDEDMELVLRKPHLENAEAAILAATASLEKAQLDVERCSITAPFNSIIQDKFEDLGARVSLSTPLLTIIGTDEYWVEVAVPSDELQWITIPKENSESGSKVKIYNPTAWGPDIYREGAVIRLLGKLEEQGRQAQLLVSVKDPLCLKIDSPQIQPILINSYVRVDIQGKKIESVIPVARDYLRDGNNIWIMNDRNEMEIRPVKIVFRNKETVYLSGGIKAGEQIVTTDISAPVDKMLLRVNDTPDNPETIQLTENRETK